MSESPQTIKRLITDDTGQDIVSALEDLTAAVKPDATDINMSSTDNTTVAAEVGKLRNDIGIVEDTNTATHTIAAEQYVIWKGELYKALTAIPSGTTLSASNLGAVSNGIANELNGNLTALSSKTTITTNSVKSGMSITSFNGVYTSQFVIASCLFSVSSSVSGVLFKTNLAGKAANKYFPIVGHDSAKSYYGYVGGNGEICSDNGLSVGSYVFNFCLPV